MIEGRLFYGGSRSWYSGEKVNFAMLFMSHEQQIYDS
jgi:hypothetical protein